MKLTFATDNGIHTLSLQTDKVTHLGVAIEEQALTALAQSGAALFAGSRQGLWCRTEPAADWQPIPGTAGYHIRWLHTSPNRPGIILAGTEPADILRSDDSGQTWQSHPEVTALRDRFGWWLPYSQEAGCVRGFTRHGQRLYAAVEVGGLLRSDDDGLSWQLVDGSEVIPKFNRPPVGHIHADVHDVAVHPADRDLIIGFTNQGTYRSENGGQHWDHINAEGYTRSGWLDPHNAARVLVGPARSVGRGGSLRLTEDGGASWRDASRGLHKPWPDDMIERIVEAGSALLLLSDRGRVFYSPRADWNWRALPADIPAARAAVYAEQH